MTIEKRIDAGRSAFVERYGTDPGCNAAAAEDFLTEVLLFVASDYGTVTIEQALSNLRSEWNANHIHLEEHRSV